jgi:hypothetical protein
MILAFSILVVLYRLFSNSNGLMWEYKDNSLTIKFGNILFIPCAVYVIYFFLNFFDIL